MRSTHLCSKNGFPGRHSDQLSDTEPVRIRQTWIQHLYGGQNLVVIPAKGSKAKARKSILRMNANDPASPRPPTARGGAAPFALVFRPAVPLFASWFEKARALISAEATGTVLVSAALTADPQVRSGWAHLRVDKARKTANMPPQQRSPKPTAQAPCPRPL